MASDKRFDCENAVASDISNEFTRSWRRMKDDLLIHSVGERK